jgi:hypothetical protein
VSKWGGGKSQAVRHWSGYPALPSVRSPGAVHPKVHFYVKRRLVPSGSNLDGSTPEDIVHDA